MAQISLIITHWEPQNVALIYGTIGRTKSFYGIRLGCHCKSSSVGNMDQWAHAIKAFMVIALDFSLLVFQIKNLLE